MSVPLCSQGDKVEDGDFSSEGLLKTGLHTRCRMCGQEKDRCVCPPGRLVWPGGVPGAREGSWGGDYQVLAAGGGAISQGAPHCLDKTLVNFLLVLGR